jgi:ubiquinone/menaquinone biosynthesis C-methylase UbiE
MHAGRLHNDPNFKFSDGIYYQNDFVKTDFEETYLDIRKKEGRIFSDKEVSVLPEIDTSHSLAGEWQIRKYSSKKLFDYLAKIPGPKNILEVGCGNGWLTHQLSLLNNSNVTGVDVNELELKQAARVFNRINNINFVLGDIFSVQFPAQFDFIILASSIQYFENPEKLISALLRKLSARGELYIIDSPFYSDQTVTEAKARSLQYFDSLNSKMADRYYHHSLDQLAKFNPVVLHDPKSLLTRIKNIFEVSSPFPWIRINRDK